MYPSGARGAGRAATRMVVALPCTLPPLPPAAPRRRRARRAAAAGNAAAAAAARLQVLAPAVGVRRGREPRDGGRRAGGGCRPEGHGLGACGRHAQPPRHGTGARVCGCTACTPPVYDACMRACLHACTIVHCSLFTCTCTRTSTCTCSCTCVTIASWHSSARLRSSLQWRRGRRRKQLWRQRWQLLSECRRGFRLWRRRRRVRARWTRRAWHRRDAWSSAHSVPWARASSSTCTMAASPACRRCSSTVRMPTHFYGTHTYAVLRYACLPTHAYLRMPTYACRPSCVRCTLYIPHYASPLHLHCISTSFV